MANDIPEFFAELREVEYETKLNASLSLFEEGELRSGKLARAASFVLRTADRNEYGFSQWVSPKRTRTYPYARVYDTLAKKNRITLIPFCKDEGADGDRDFVQWDTVSLMSLLNVHVILGYYARAEKSARPKQAHKDKITGQVHDYAHVCKQIKELQKYHSSALHWNLAQMEQLETIARKTLDAYQKITKETGVRMHNPAVIEKRIAMLAEDVAKFKDLSRQLAADAQNRETLTEQPKEEALGTKAKITMRNLLGGHYFMTADECFVVDGRVFLVEKKHSNTKSLPHEGDIKDAFIKMALFANIDKLRHNGKEKPHRAAVGLTSKTTRGILHSNMSVKEIRKFCADNKFKEAQRQFITKAIEEARCNGFGLFFVNPEEAEAKQADILKALV